MDTTASNLNDTWSTVEDRLLRDNPNGNIEKSERIVSLGTGAFITLKGITNIFSSPMLALSELVIGGALLYRGMSGYCPVKGMVENQNISAVPERVIPTEAY